MLRSVVSSIEFKFRRNWSENEQLSVSLLWSLEVNSASHSPWVVRQVVSQSTMKFASDSPQFSYVEITLLRTN
ncbi:hypothetical protein MAL08_18730 [Leptospira noguchii]|uniref:hypothetical protein n=1 Tax=Leptospira noguchii TaxID=28182 RepID=UPI001FB70C4A|nr:hypothetical protein [Leptospira noguchii]UOG39648.1 hypothetical protein MAL08_18730 [Leptospira noguchii]